MPNTMLRSATAALARFPLRVGVSLQLLAASCLAAARRQDARRAAAFSLAATAFVLASDPALASAGGGGDFTSFLQNLVNLLTGPAGKFIAVIGICIVGIGALMGALSLRVAGGVVLGVMVLFSSAWIVEQIVGA